MPGRTTDLARHGEGRAATASRPFLMAPVLESATRALQLRRERPDVRLQLSVDPPWLEANGDPERIRRLVTNLLEHAIRRSPEGGRVAVGAFAPDDATVELSVVDEGTPASARGSGLRLAVARRIADHHGGCLRAEHRHPQGYRMVVGLPRAGSR